MQTDVGAMTSASYSGFGEDKGDGTDGLPGHIVSEASACAPSVKP